MRVFTDANGRSWSLAVDLPNRDRVLADTQFDLFEAIDQDQLAKLSRPQVLIPVLFSLSRPDAEAAKITPEQFARAMIGDVLEEASEALLGALTDFFPSRRRKPLQALLAKSKEASDRQAEILMQRVSDLNVSDLMAGLSNDVATSSPPSSASSPAD